MDQSLTPAQLYADLVAAYARPTIPDGAFTVKQFADDAGIGNKAAYEALTRKVAAGELGTVCDGRRAWYYFKTAEVLSE
jgi:hypothetical protein